METTSHVVNHALAELFARPRIKARAIAAAAEPDPATFDGYVWEALRFNPAFPYSFRVAQVPTVLAADTEHATGVPAGTTVLMCTHSAMLDPAVPFGGYGVSGFGRESGPHHIDEYLETKAVWINLD